MIPTIELIYANSCLIMDNNSVQFSEMRNFNVTCFQTSQCITVAATCRDNGVGIDLCLCALQNEYYDSSIDECLAGKCAAGSVSVLQ